MYSLYKSPDRRREELVLKWGYMEVVLIGGKNLVEENGNGYSLYKLPHRRKEMGC